MNFLFSNAFNAFQVINQQSNTPSRNQNSQENPIHSNNASNQVFANLYGNTFEDNFFSQSPFYRMLFQQRNTNTSNTNNTQTNANSNTSNSQSNTSTNQQVRPNQFSYVITSSNNDGIQIINYYSTTNVQSNANQNNEVPFSLFTQFVINKTPKPQDYRHIIDKKPTRKVTEDSDYECIVCLCSLKKDDDVVDRDCKHTYHKNCLSEWFKEHNKCPTCRREVI
jgi:hypothetical protein